MANEQITPSTVAPPAANYAHAVLTTGATRWLHTSGVVPARPDGSVPDDIGEQAAVIWRTIDVLLSEAGMSATDVVSVTTYAVAGSPLAPIMAARDRYLGGHRASSTLVTVPALARPEWRVELAVIAAA